LVAAALGLLALSPVAFAACSLFDPLTDYSASTPDTSLSPGDATDTPCTNPQAAQGLCAPGGSDAQPERDAQADTADACVPIAPGYALSFENTPQPQFVTISDATALHLMTAMTIEAWVIPQDMGLTDNCIVCKPVGSAGGNSLALIVWFSGGPSLSWEVTTPGASDLNAWSSDAGAWHHIAATWDGVAQTQQLFIDGTLAGTFTDVIGPPTYDNHPLLIGSDIIQNGAYALGYKGTIDEVRLFSTARTSQQIAADVTGGCSPVGDSTLVAYYPFNEGGGTVVHDASSHHLDGTLGNGDAGSAPTWVTSTIP
jgi:hypothetical protein